MATAAWIVLLAGPAAAQSITPSTKPAAPKGMFVWIDGSYQSIELPAYGLGFFEVSTATFEKLRAVKTYNPNPTGAGINGGIGYALPHGTLPGANSRVSVVGNFVGATLTENTETGSTGNVIQLLNGFLIAPCGNCVIPSRLHTEYQSWRVGLNATTDFRVGRVTLSPSVEIIGGQSSTRQTYAQSRLVFGGPPAFYDATTKMKWEDAGAKLGLAVSVPITPTIEFGISGTLAVVYRNATLNGNDRSDDGFGIISTSVVNFSRSTGAVIPGAQAQITATPMSNVKVKVFGGLEHDTRVPGIVAPSFTPAEFLASIPVGTQATPGQIGFSSQTSYHAGLGVTVAFAP